MLSEEVFHRKYKFVSKEHDHWVVTDPGRDDRRKGKKYPLKRADENEPEKDPMLPGLRDPVDFNKLWPVERPVESAKEAPPKIDTPAAASGGGK